MPAPLEVPGEIKKGVIVYAFLDDAVDFDRTKARPLGGLDPRKHPVQGELAPIQPAKNFGIQAVETHGQAPQPLPPQLTGHPFEESPVGRQGKIVDPLDRTQLADQFVQPMAQQGFTSGNPKLPNAQRRHYTHQALDLFERENFFPRQEGVPLAEDFGRHAVGATEITAIRYRDPKIPERAVETVEKH